MATPFPAAAPEGFVSLVASHGPRDWHTRATGFLPRLGPCRFTMKAVRFLCYSHDCQHCRMRKGRVQLTFLKQLSCASSSVVGYTATSCVGGIFTSVVCVNAAGVTMIMKLSQGDRVCFVRSRLWCRTFTLCDLIRKREGIASSWTSPEFNARSLQQTQLIAITVAYSFR